MNKFFRHIRKIRTQHLLLLICLIVYYFSIPDQLFDAPYSFVLEDNNGKLLGAKIANDGQWRFPESKHVPVKYEKALLHFEDQRFYKHLGVDPIAVFRAIYENTKSKKIVSGASTLNMQIMRLSRKNRERSYWQKLIESIQATRLEFRYSKNQILNIYASHAPFGGNVVGLEAASWRYFNKSPDQLTWAESATLAVLPNSPSLIHPGKNRSLLLKKRNKLLLELFESGEIDEWTYKLSMEESLPEKPKPMPQKAPHLLEHLKINNNTDRIKSSIDSRLQEQARDVLEFHHELNREKNIYNAAILIADTETGEILAYHGNIKGKSHQGDVDMVQARRSSGSILKPFLYASLLESGELLPNELIQDIPTLINGYTPKNYDKNFRGVVKASEALAMSLNVPAVLSLQKYGVEKFRKKLIKLGFTTIDYNADHYGLPLILGGAEVSLFDLVSVYASMGRTLNHFYDYSGRYDPSDFRPLQYQTILREPVELDKLHSESSYLSASAIWSSLLAMKKVQRPNQEGEWELFESNREFAWKTGTSYGHRDAWAVGLNPKYTIGVWVGNSDGEGQPDIIGVKTAGAIMFDLLNNFENVGWFEQPIDEMVLLPTCKKSGKIAHSNCLERDTIAAPALCQNGQICDKHLLIHLSEDEAFQVNQNCYEGNIVSRPWFVLNSIESYYYKMHHSDYQSLPDFSKECMRFEYIKDHAMEIIYPQNNTQIFIPTDLDGKKSKTIFKANHKDNDSGIYWHLNNKYLGRTKHFHTMDLNAEAGKYTLTLVDDLGRTVVNQFEILAE